MKMNLMTSRLLMLVMVMCIQSSEAVRCYHCGPGPDTEETSRTCDNGDVCFTASAGKCVFATIIIGLIILIIIIIIIIMMMMMMIRQYL